MINGIAYKEVVEYTLPEDTVNPTVWLIGALDSITQDRMTKQYMEFDMNAPEKRPTIKADYDPFEQDKLTVKIGLKGFRNFKVLGKDIKFETEEIEMFGEKMIVMTDDVLKRIHSAAIHKLARVIWDENLVTPEEEKN